jgi:hypothetical protein
MFWDEGMTHDLLHNISVYDDDGSKNYTYNEYNSRNPFLCIIPTITALLTDWTSPSGWEGREVPKMKTSITDKYNSELSHLEIYQFWKKVKLCFC